jgi:ATP-dependent protease Clp ATPase subunit
MQLYDQMLVRHGIMLVGPTGGGKTVSRNILQKALSVLPTFADKTIDKNKPHLVFKIRNYYCFY